MFSMTNWVQPPLFGAWKVDDRRWAYYVWDIGAQDWLFTWG